MKTTAARVARNRTPIKPSRVRRGQKLIPVTLEGRVIYLRPQTVKILRAAQKLKGAF